MENIKFSIIIPAYNCENYISKCLESIFNQTYKNVEVIVVDDCSTDNTFEILKNYENIKLLSTTINSRQGAARNKGLDSCTGDYILFIDSDDSLYDNNVLNKLANLINTQNLPDIVYLGLKMYGKRDLLLIPDEKNCEKEYRLSENPFINVISIAWKNTLIQENNIRFPEKIKYEDVYFAFLGIEKAKSYAYGDFIYYSYNNRESSTTTTYSLTQATDTIQLISKLFELYEIIDKENIPYLSRRIQQQTDRTHVRLNRAVEQELKKYN